MEDTESSYQLQKAQSILNEILKLAPSRDILDFKKRGDFKVSTIF